MSLELLCKETPTQGHNTVSGKSRQIQMGSSLVLAIDIYPWRCWQKVCVSRLLCTNTAYVSGVSGVPAERQHAAVGRESMTVRRVLDKRVDYIKRVWHINPLTHSYTTIKRFTTCLQMLSTPPSLSYGDIEFSTLRCKRFPTWPTKMKLYSLIHDKNRCHKILVRSGY